MTYSRSENPLLLSARLSLVSLTAILLLVACASGQSIERRALGFYSFLAGQRANDSLEDYVSPAFRSGIDSAQGKAMFENMKLALSPSGSRLGPIDPKNIRVAQEGNYALTWLEGRPDQPLVGSSPVRWVKTGKRWYLYFGSEQEVKAYKDFPSALRAEEPRPPKASETTDSPPPQKEAGPDKER
ncbi:MAG: hypothetical protein A2Y63_01230 [Candidatus Riflebacteria bacterium RBG_13_59_9]|nr:MAG: hypothetical protein A2Y63_01230 [Candidatus Riflebacteria bacterium RBG_13_59_9]